MSEEKRDYSGEGLGNVVDVPDDSADYDDEVFVISRVAINYAVIAVTFLLVGVAIGAVIFRATTPPISEAKLADLVQNAVAAAFNAQTGDTANAEPEGLDVNTVYTVSSDGDPFIGAADAPVTIVEFSDFRCGYCGRFAKETLPQLLDTYGDQIRFVYRDYPQFGQLSVLAAMGAECADDQGKFWEFHNQLFENASQISDEFLTQLAEQLDLDMDTFNTCMEEQTHYDEIVEDFKAGQEFGPIGTPTFFVNGKPVIGAQPYPVFASAIDDALKALDETASAG